MLLQRHGELQQRLEEVQDDEEEAPHPDDYELGPEVQELTATQTSRQLIGMFAQEDVETLAAAHGLPSNSVVGERLPGVEEEVEDEGGSDVLSDGGWTIDPGETTPRRRETRTSQIQGDRAPADNLPPPNASCSRQRDPHRLQPATGNCARDTGKGQPQGDVSDARSNSRSGGRTPSVPLSSARSSLFQPAPSLCSPAARTPATATAASTTVPASITKRGTCRTTASSGKCSDSDQEAFSLQRVADWRPGSSRGGDKSGRPHVRASGLDPN